VDRVLRIGGITAPQPPYAQPRLSHGRPAQSGTTEGERGRPGRAAGERSLAAEGREARGERRPSLPAPLARKMATQAKTKFKRLSIEKCGECGADSARLFCGRCQQQYYCSDECQLEHWTAHKPDCVPVEEQDRRKKLGEMMVKAGGDGQLRLVQQLVEGRGVDVNFVNAEWHTVLLLASLCNRVQMVDWLVAAGARVNHAHRVHGATALHVASEWGHIAVVRSLVRAGADVNQAATDELSSSPLIVACTHNRPLVADALLQAGARVGFVRKDRFTALGMACEEGHIECVRMLIRAGADVNQACADELGSSPLIQASGKGHVHVVDALIAAGCQLNYARPKDGCTALIMASQLGFIDVVRSLLAAGADPEHDGFAVLDFAKHFKHSSVAALLEAKLAELAGGSK